jgi:hypothetical protein
MKIFKQWPNEPIRLIPGTTIPYENWIQAWIVTNITKRKAIKEEKRREKNWSQKKHEDTVFEPIDLNDRTREERINSYFTADVPDERDFENKQTKDNDHD